MARQDPAEIRKVYRCRAFPCDEEAARKIAVSLSTSPHDSVLVACGADHVGIFPGVVQSEELPIQGALQLRQGSPSSSPPIAGTGSPCQVY